MKKAVDYYVAYGDGACEPTNPGGNMGVGAFILDPHRKRIFEHSEYIVAHPHNSNNVAEYLALLAVLGFFINEGITAHPIKYVGDSQLVIKQMAGDWSANKGAYLKYYQKASQLIILFDDITFHWIPREQNELADELSKKAMIANKCEFKIQKR